MSGHTHNPCPSVEEALRKRTHELGERIKELDCLYAIYSLSEKRDISVKEILQGACGLIPPAWQYPDITCGRITHQGQIFESAGCRETPWRQAADIFVEGECAGLVEVFYLEDMPAFDEGPFLKEERSLINAIAEQLGLLIGRVLTAEALRHSTHDLGERVKELDCLYAIYSLSQKSDVSADEILRGACRLIPPAWHYPHITCARITHDTRAFTTPDFRETPWRQAADIMLRGARIGSVEVFYLQEMPALDEGPFLKEERSLINAIADQLALLIERVHAEEALRESERKLHELSQQVIAAQEAERARLSRELHDDLGHQLAALRLELDWLIKKRPHGLTPEDLGTIMGMVTTATAELRRICKGIRPMIPDYMGLALAMEALVDDFRAHSATQILMDLHPVRNAAFDPDIAINLYRMLQETLTNIARHSRAGHVSIRFGEQDGQLALDVRDDGIGMPDPDSAESRGLGIVGMRERAALCGGSVVIDSTPGRGARVQVRIPAPAMQDPDNEND